MLRLGIVLPQSAGTWRERHAMGLVPDASPYGLHRLESSNVEPIFSDGAPEGKMAERLLRRLTSWNWAAARAAQASPSDAFLAWEETHGLPLLLRAGRRLPVYTGVIWASDEAMSAPLRRLTGAALRRAAGIFVLSRLQVPVLIDRLGVRAERVHFLPFGIDADFFRPQPEARSTGGPTVFSAGSDRHRDFDLLIRAVAQLRELRPQLRLRLATRALPEGPLPGGVGECLGVIAHPAMRAELCRAEVVAVTTKPNLHGSGMTTVLEGMACERPVIAMANTGLEDYMADGVSGRLVPAGDLGALAGALADVLDDPDLAARQGAEGRRTVLRKHTSAGSVERLGRMIVATEAGRGAPRSSHPR